MATDCMRTGYFPLTSKRDFEYDITACRWLDSSWHGEVLTICFDIFLLCCPERGSNVLSHIFVNLWISPSFRLCSKSQHHADELAWAHFCTDFCLFPSEWNPKPELVSDQVPHWSITTLHLLEKKLVLLIWASLTVSPWGQWFIIYSSAVLSPFSWIW